MANRITFIEARNAYERLVTSVLPIGTAIQEAVNLYYDMGRWPGTTRELTLVDGDFTEDTDREAWILTIDDDVYDGVLGIRNNSRGWNIRGQLALYRDRLNSGDLDFIDLEGSETAATSLVQATYQRKFRCPLDFSLANGPYYALLKLDAPQLVNDADIVPVPSTAALKALIMAVSYETANDPQRQQASMQSFEQAMSRASREIQGRRSMPLMTTTTMRSRPQQFP